LPDRHQGDYSANADDDTEHRQTSPQFVRDERFYRDRECVTKVQGG
jgi:hypothetical protein